MRLALGLRLGSLESVVHVESSICLPPNGASPCSMEVMVNRGKTWYSQDAGVPTVLSLAGTSQLSFGLQSCTVAGGCDTGEGAESKFQFICARLRQI